MKNRRRTLFLLGLAFLSASLAGCGLWARGGAAPGPGRGEDYVSPNPATPAGPAEKTITLYFADSQAQHVVPEERQVEAGNRPLPELVMQELLQGPREPYLHRGIPEGVTVRSVALEEKSGLVTVDFEHNVVDRFPQGSAGQAMFMQSLLFTMFELPGAESLQILVEGGKVEVLGDLAVGGAGRRTGILTYPVLLDPDRTRWLQQEADQGRQTWRRDPLEVAKRDGRMAGFRLEDQFTLIKRVKVGEYSGTGQAEVRAVHQGKAYVIELIQPATIGEDGIWTINSIREA